MCALHEHRLPGYDDGAFKDSRRAGEVARGGGEEEAG